MVQFVFIFLFHMQSHEIQYFIANKIKCLEHSLSSTCIKQSYSNIKSVLKSQLQVIFWHRLFHSLILLLALKQVFSGLRSLMGFILMQGTSHLGVNRGFLSDCHNLRSFKYIVNMHKYLVILKTQPFCDAREQNSRRVQFNPVNVAKSQNQCWYHKPVADNIDYESLAQVSSSYKEQFLKMKLTYLSTPIC